MARNIQVDTLRGLACILLVAYHVVGYNASAGLRIGDGLYRDLSDLLAYLRMPLFTFLSGMVYAYRPFSGEVQRYVVGKARRLLVPMLVVGTLFALLQAWSSGSNGAIEHWHLLHIYPVAHFWFIEAIFWVFLLMIPLESMGALSNKIGFSAVLLAAILLYLTVSGTPMFAISGAIYLLPYFLLGMGLQRYFHQSSHNVWLGGALSASVLAILVLMYAGEIPLSPKRSILALIIGGTACTGLLFLNLRSNTLAYIGIFSYSIYLYHVFFTAGTRIALYRLGVADLHILFIVSVCAGLVGPVLIEIALERVRARLHGRAQYRSGLRAGVKE